MFKTKNDLSTLCHYRGKGLVAACVTLLRLKAVGYVV